MAGAKKEVFVSSVRDQRRNLSFAEKLKILDKLRERNRVFAEARRKLKNATAPKQESR